MNIKALYIIFGVLIVIVGVAAVSKYSMKTEAPVENEYLNSIRVVVPTANMTVSSPLVISGSARGSWYWEASFPVMLVDANGKLLAGNPASGQGDWMTENFVPFTSTLTFETPTTKTGTLILQNDNPSGLAENSKEVRIPVQFSVYQEIRSAEFGKEIILKAGDKVFYPGGLSVSLVKINDSRCMTGVTCVWIGELSAVLAVDNSVLNMPAREISIGTVLNRSVNVGSYTFTLVSATEDSATIVVGNSPAPVSVGIGSVTGYIYLGPTCPVQQEPPDPRCDVRPYANAKVEFLPKNGGASVKSVVSDIAGNFEVKLEAGTYTAVIYQKSTLSLPSCPTTEVIVKAKQTTAIEISCDTGIR